MQEPIYLQIESIPPNWDPLAIMPNLELRADEVASSLKTVPCMQVHGRGSEGKHIYGRGKLGRELGLWHQRRRRSGEQWRLAGCGQVAGKRRVDGVEQRMVAGTNGDWVGSSGAYVAGCGRG